MAEAKVNAEEQEVAKTEEKKKSYIVVRAFEDLQDNNKRYEVNDPFPKPGNKKVTQKRIDELVKHSNGNVYIKEK